MVQFVDVRVFQKKCSQATCAWDAPQQGMHAPKKKREKKIGTSSRLLLLFMLDVDKQTVTKPADAGLFFFAKRTCVSPAVVADQTAVLTDDSNVKEVATSEALSESDGSGTESQSDESEFDVCSTACQNEDEAILDFEAETDGAVVSDTVT